MLVTKLLHEASVIEPEVIAWRQYLHQHPELSFHEHQTADYIEKVLQTFHHLQISRPTPTSVMARLIGAKHGQTLAIRADIDALPIDEETNLQFTSQTAGAMHACGHDGHTATVLGVAKVLSAHQAELAGEVRFIFQHAEELPPGGAKEMIAAGVMDNVDAIIGAHLQSPIEVGKVGVIVGPMLASPDIFNITIHGKGGHAAEPHTFIDSIAIGSQIVTNLQHLVSRYVKPTEPLVLSVTQFNAGYTHNVIPENATLGGTVRCIQPALREDIRKQMEQIVKGITEAHGATYDFSYHYGYDPLVNDAAITALVAEAITELYGEDALYTIQPNMAADDFSAFLQYAPGTYFNIGAGNKAKGIVYPHHHSKFTIDEGALLIGMNVFLAATVKFLHPTN
ncbi:amidohydrolase [Metasolibacillus meyeri]|uniref:amidohydrolase n=1 Tax=Metasolibacillus meyeri TaxID=1071052 RepID=UPI000D2FB108|nr:amidohydrolase [Metasolibacillus meyeri]